jgi:arabinofuranan 3-O-arabinosyltransferase
MGLPSSSRSRLARLDAWGAGHLPPLWAGVLLVVLGSLAASRLQLFAVTLYQGTSGNDFAQYYVAAQTGMAHGWAAVYDVATYASHLRQVTGSPDGFANLPPAAWAVAPFTVLPFRPADVLWQLLLLGVLVATWRASTAGPEWRRMLLLAAALATFPVLFALYLGQLVLVVGALLVLHWRLLRAGRPVLAGIVLGLAFVEPQDLALVPVALLVAGRWRTAAACAITVAVLAAAVLLALGPDGVAAYRSSLAHETASWFIARHSLERQLPAWAPGTAIKAVVVAAALLFAFSHRRGSYEPVLMTAIIGSFLVTPYLNPEDLSLLVVCAWMLPVSEASRAQRALIAAGYPLLVVDNLISPAPLIIVELLWLAVGLARTKPRRSTKGPSCSSCLRARLGG